MDQTNDGGPAFPRTPFDVNDYTGDGSPGMSLRDYFAGQALASMDTDGLTSKGLQWAAARVYEMADAMLVERQKGRE